MFQIDLIIFTDFWRVRGSNISDFLVRFTEMVYADKHTVRIFSPRDCPFAPRRLLHSERRWGLFAYWRIKRILRNNDFKGIFIATPNGPIGLCARFACWQLGLAYSTNKPLRYPSDIPDLMDASIWAKILPRFYSLLVGKYSDAS